MDKKIYIIHRSAIVQEGLSNILLKSFKCIVVCYYDLATMMELDNNSSSNIILFIEDKVTNCDEYVKFIEKFPFVNTYSITNYNEEKEFFKTRYSISLFNSPDVIYELVKDSFKQQERIEDESEGLSNREIDVLKLVALGFANKEIAEKLFISIHTVMSHRKNMTEKLGIKSISGLTVYAIINNFIDTTNLNIKDLI